MNQLIKQFDFYLSILETLFLMFWYFKIFDILKFKKSYRFYLLNFIDKIIQSINFKSIFDKTIK